MNSTEIWSTVLINKEFFHIIIISENWSSSTMKKLILSFHPEISHDLRMHEYFLTDVLGLK